jgi:teichuronic acid biosynthesis glycosyltransferase TuaH
VSSRVGTPTRLLILIHVDWDWIKQRPHFLAEHLARDKRFKVLVLFIPSWRRWMLTENPSSIPRLPLLVLPARGNRVLERANRLLARILITVVASRWRPTAVLTTSPRIYDYLPKQILGLPLFYDCMDVADAFVSRSQRGPIQRAERALVSSASCIFVSSAYLADLIERRYRGTARRVVLVRNGWDGESRSIAKNSLARPTAIVRVAYVGTVSHWLDLATIEACLDRFPNLEIHLIGPKLVDVPAHRRLVSHGAIRHDQLRTRLRDYDAFVLPFVVTDLTRGVDPVKMYEYLAYGRPVLAAYYPELEHFGDLVSFYRDRQQLYSLLERLFASPASLCPDQERVREFLAGATWGSRGEHMAETMTSVLSGSS